MVDTVVQGEDEKLARVAIVEGWNNCKASNYLSRVGKACDCDLGAIDGCVEKVRSVAKAIAMVRGLAIEDIKSLCAANGFSSITQAVTTARKAVEANTTANSGQ